MQPMIKLLSHIRTILVRLLEASTSRPLPEGVFEFLNWDVTSTPLVVAVSESTVKVYGLHAFNPTIETIYLRLYDTPNPNFETELPLEIFELAPLSGTTVLLDGRVKYEVNRYLTIVATSSFKPTQAEQAPPMMVGYPQQQVDSTIFVRLHFGITLPVLVPGQSFITDSQGNYLIDSESNLLITQSN
jgi:hypothetical protein